MQIGIPKPTVLIHNEQKLFRDGESMLITQKLYDPHAKTQPYFGYILTSLSNDRDEKSKPMRQHFTRFEFHIDAKDHTLIPRRAVVINAAAIRKQLTTYLDKAGIKLYRTFNSDFARKEKNTYRWGNIAAMASAPNKPNVLLCGMRNPLAGTKAIAFALENVKPAFDQEDPSQLKITDMFSLDLGNRGISDMCWDGVTKGYLISATKSNGLKTSIDQLFPPNTLDSALFWWSGRKTDKPVLFARVPDMKIEAICRLGTSRFIAIGSDEGDISEGREGRQSVVTILDFTGITRSNESSPPK
jgi:hypothetical protein